VTARPVLTRQVEVGTGEGNQNEMTIHFGLKDHRGPLDLQVFWPGGRRRTIANVEPNRLITITFDAKKHARGDPQE